MPYFFSFYFAITAALGALPIAAPLAIISLISEDKWSKWPKIMRAFLIFVAIEGVSFAAGGFFGHLIDSVVPAILSSYIAA